ncbi:MAG: hypothetical protein JRN15_14750 [Nitrososphaerota archaeon]|nr:hypothetical protein [Nitrososphaerota archaeon]
MRSVPEALTHAFDFSVNAPTLVPKSCATICQCKQYFPCYLPKHNPCGFEILFEKNHTHVLVKSEVGNVTRKICVSPKCISPSIVVSCYQCSVARQRRSPKVILEDLVWSWRLTSLENYF